MVFAAGFFAAGFFAAAKGGARVPAHVALVASVAATTLVWVAVSYLAPPTDRRTLVAFYERVRPAGPGWAAVRRETTLPPSPDSVPQMLLGWTLGCAFVYAALFGAGSFLYGRTAQGLVWLSILIVSGVGLARLLPRLWSRSKSTAC